MQETVAQGSDSEALNHTCVCTRKLVDRIEDGWRVSLARLMAQHCDTWHLRKQVPKLLSPNSHKRNKEKKAVKTTQRLDLRNQSSEEKFSKDLKRLKRMTNSREGQKRCKKSAASLKACSALNTEKQERSWRDY